MREADRQNIDVAKAWLEKRKAVTAGALLLYAFSPFPSNYLFIAYGLTRLKLWLIGVPFFFGRLASYAVWTYFAQVAHSYLDPELDLDGGYLGVYFVVSQLALLGLVFVLMRIDWSAALNEHRLRFRRVKPGENVRT
jgi:membrane protein DedA with SNARE-associated domain